MDAHREMCRRVRDSMAQLEETIGAHSAERGDALHHIVHIGCNLFDEKGKPGGYLIRVKLHDDSLADVVPRELNGIPILTCIVSSESCDEGSLP